MQTAYALGDQGQFRFRHVGEERQSTKYFDERELDRSHFVETAWAIFSQDPHCRSLALHYPMLQTSRCAATSTRII